MQRRDFLKSLTALLGASTMAAAPFPASSAPAIKVTPLKKSKAEWKSFLEPDRYAILFEESTERAGSSALNQEKRAGTFVCAACFLPLFDASKKFDSGTGWPSFFDALPGHVDTRTDFKLFYPRKEYHCARCGGHQGHIFDDGPQPTGLRYCNNGLALNFIPSGTELPALRT